MSSDRTPQWFTDAVAHGPEHRRTSVLGCPVGLRCWGSSDRPGLVFVHGGSACGAWWDHIAPSFAGAYRVAAVDLSGHGDSGWRPSYDMRTWAREVIAAAEAADITGPVTVVGHSMGGWVTAVAGAEFGDRIAGAVIIDSPLNDAAPEEEILRRRRRPTKIYGDRAEILSRFSTVPVQETVLPYIREHVAAQSIRAVEGGWTWKFDPGMFDRRPPVRDILPELRCRTALIRCERGLLSEAMQREIGGLLGTRAVERVLPAAGHHPMFDQPQALVAQVREIIDEWVLERA